MTATYTTLVGRMATTPERVTYESGATRVSFRVACTERRRTNHGWEDGDTLYITVRCWRQLGDNVHESLSSGDPVVVQGRIFTRSVDREGHKLSVTEMEASAVGPDLRWSTAVVTRTKAAVAGAPTGTPEPSPDDDPATREAAVRDPALDDPWASVEAGLAAAAETEDHGIPPGEGHEAATGGGGGRGKGARAARAEAAVRA